MINQGPALSAAIEAVIAKHMEESSSSTAADAIQSVLEVLKDYPTGQGPKQMCRLCGEKTQSGFNINFKLVPVCESCADSITLQQVQYYVRYTPKDK